MTRFRTPVLLIVLSILATLALAPDASAQEQPPFRLGPVSIVASAGARFRVFPGVSVALRDEAIQVYLAEAFKDPSVETAFREAIMQGLVDRGYSLAPPGENSYDVGFVLSLDDGMSNAELIERLGFSPGLPSGGDRFERGTLAVLLMMPDSDEVAWRGAIQAFADMEGDPELRAQRIRLATARLLRALPEAPR